MKPKASFVFVALFVSLTSVQAADTWLGTTSASWNVDANWQDSTKPVSEDLVTFDVNSAANLSTILDGVFTVPGLVVTSPTAAVTIANGTGGSLAIGTSGIDMSAATANLTFSFTANSLVSFSADQTFNIAASRTLTFSGTANNRTFALGSRVITKTGTGTLAINPGVSLASGTFDLQAGNTTIAAGSNISTTTASTVSYKVGTGATLSPIYNSGTLTFASPIELAGGTLATSGGSSHTFSGAISGSGGIISATQSSTGTVNNTFSGGFTGSGTFDLRCQNYSSNNHAFILSGNNSNFTGTFNINAASGTKVVRITNANGGSSSANWNVLAANNLQVSNVSVSLGNLNVYSGSTASFLAGSTVAFPTGKTVLIDAQATTTATNLTVAGTVNSAASVTIGRYGVMNVNTGATWNQSGDFYIAGTGGYGASVSVNTGGTFNYTGANTFKMNTAPSNSSYFTVNGGTFTTTNALQSSVGGSSSAYNGIFVLQNSGTFRLMADVTDLTAEPSGTGRKNLFQLGTGGGTIDTNGFSAALSQNITGAGALIKAGGGTLTLSGTNTYSGDTTINGGVLTLSTATLANA